MSSGDAIVLYLVTNEMAIQLDVFCAFMKNRICSNVQSNLIVTIKLGYLRMRDTEILKETSKPGKFWASGGHRSIFCLNWGARYNRLFLEHPRNKRVSKKYAITCNWPSSIRTGSPIRVTEVFELNLWGRRQ